MHRLHDERANTRIQTCLLCHLHLGESTRRGFVLSVSLTGALISSSLNPPKGTAISLSIDVPGINKPLHFNGHVVRVYRGSFMEELFRFGVRFTSITPESVLMVKTLTSGKASVAQVENRTRPEKEPSQR
jgi:hypothetical protein